MATNKGTGVMIYSMGGALLISLVTEIITATHYWRMLSGVPLIAIGGLAFVAWTQIWSTAWAVWERQDKTVQRVAYAASLFVTLMMIVNAGFVLSTRGRENKDDVRARQEKVEIEELKGLDHRVAREILRQRAEERKQRAEEEKREKALNETGRHETSLSDIRDSYMDFWIYVVPFAMATLAKFCVLAAISLPGGASGYLPSRQPMAGPAPNPVPGSGPTPTPTPTPNPTDKEAVNNSPNPVQKIPTRGGAGSKNS
jgi:hypothetical protein